jgi:hypothetical protein
MFDHLHVADAETACQAMTVHVALRSMMVNGIRSAICLKRAVGTTGKRLVTRHLEQSSALPRS